MPSRPLYQDQCPHVSLMAMLLMVHEQQSCNKDVGKDRKRLHLLPVTGKKNRKSDSSSEQTNWSKKTLSPFDPAVNRRECPGINRKGKEDRQASLSCLRWRVFGNSELFLPHLDL